MNYEGVLKDSVGNRFYPKTRYGYIKMKGQLYSGISFDDVVNMSDSSAYTINADSYKNNTLAGYPAGAYKYGTLITINPTQTTNDKWSIVQIYVPDGPAEHGVYFRTHTNRKWVKLSGETINPTS